MGGRRLPFACSSTHEIDREIPRVTLLALECEPHPDVPKREFFSFAGYPIVELHHGRGIVTGSEMML
jgi:hypothetical protein